MGGELYRLEGEAGGERKGGQERMGMQDAGVTGGEGKIGIEPRERDVDASGEEREPGVRWS